MAWTTTDLLADVRRRAMMPAAQTLGTTDADLLEHANNEMASRLVPLVQSVNEEFYVQTKDVGITSGVGAYRFPDRNSGGKLRDATYILGATQYNLARIEPERLTQWILNASGSPAAFYLEAGALNLIPTPSGGGTVRMKYYVRPGRFTSTASDYGVITGVTYTGANSVTLTWSGGMSLSNGALADVIAFRPPFEYLLADATVSGAAAGTATLTISSPTSPPPDFSRNIAVGDYVTKRDLSPILQLPVELHSLLAQRVVCAIMESFGYGERLQMAEVLAQRLEQAALKLISPRVDGAPRKQRGILANFGRSGLGWWR
jgi:hypothetical protein